MVEHLCPYCGGETILRSDVTGNKNLGTEEEPDIHLARERIYRCVVCRKFDTVIDILD